VGGFAVGIMSACVAGGIAAVTDQCRHDDSNLQLGDRAVT
jgi:hypothetical protein